MPGRARVHARRRRHFLAHLYAGRSPQHGSLGRAGRLAGCYRFPEVTLPSCWPRGGSSGDRQATGPAWPRPEAYSAYAREEDWRYSKDPIQGGAAVRVLLPALGGKFVERHSRPLIRKVEILLVLLHKRN